MRMSFWGRLLCLKSFPVSMLKACEVRVYLIDRSIEEFMLSIQLW